MSIIKNEIPILEFDTEQTAVISPVHENLNLILPKKCVFAFLGEYIDEYAENFCRQLWSVGGVRRRNVSDTGESFA